MKRLRIHLIWSRPPRTPGAYLVSVPVVYQSLMLSFANPLSSGEAFDETKSVFNANLARSFLSTDIRDVYEASLQIEKQLASKQRVCNMRRLRPFFEGIERYSKAIEPLCNGTPFLPWIWVRLRKWLFNTFVLRRSRHQPSSFYR